MDVNIQTLLNAEDDDSIDHIELAKKFNRAITFDVLCELEPRIRTLLNTIMILDTSKTDRFDKDHTWYTVFKPIMCKLVGFGCFRNRQPYLQTTTAYDLCYRNLYMAMPDDKFKAQMN